MSETVSVQIPGLPNNHDGRETLFASARIIVSAEGRVSTIELWNRTTGERICEILIGSYEISRQDALVLPSATDTIKAEVGEPAWQAANADTGGT